MPATYDKIATTTVSNSTTNSVTFSSISGSYTDLVLVVSSGIITSAGTNIFVRVNSDSGTNYSGTRLLGDGTTATTTRDVNDTSAVIGYSIDTGLGNSIAHFMNYSNTTTNKTILARNNNATSMARTVISVWRNTSVITSIQVYVSSTATQYYTSGSMLTLYGILKA